MLDFAHNAHAFQGVSQVDHRMTAAHRQMMDQMAYPSYTYKYGSYDFSSSRSVEVKK